MGHKLKDQAARAEYAMLRMDVALKRMLAAEADEDWERGLKWATAWGVMVRIHSPTACLKARKCRYRTDECP